MMDLAVLAFLAASIADVVTTVRGVRHPNIHEANDLVASWMNTLKLGWIVPKFVLAYGLAVYALWDDQQLLMWALAGVTGVVAANNHRLLKKVSK